MLGEPNSNGSIESYVKARAELNAIEWQVKPHQSGFSLLFC